ncbi:hypothetical protein AB0J86_18380 [Micromonospora sp. NPDC049559]|uniref:hypothetical protein n=1 Tax=Micromonospora sp. NPDC049559 TaxID=3155923 RepID=UPI003448A98C
MGDESTRVDVLSLEDFHKTLQARLDEANAILTTLSTKLHDKPPALGEFQDATETATGYQALHEDSLARARRLLRAVSATRTATDTIMHNYRTTEARNRANSDDIARVMRPVGEVLDGGRTDAR